MPDVIDYLAADRGTKAILLQLEEIERAPDFIAAVRAAARLKPVLAVKCGRHPERPGLPDGDMVVADVLRRAGVFQVEGMGDLFDALASLNRFKSFKGSRLAIISNGSGPARFAFDRLEREQGRPARFSAETRAALAKVLPGRCLVTNPLDIHGDPTPNGTARSSKFSRTIPLWMPCWSFTCRPWSRRPWRLPTRS